jgi:hypothetical protein
MRLVQGWQRAWRWFSMQAFALSAAISLAWVSMPDDIKAMMPDSWEKWVFITMAAVSFAGGWGRLIDQNKAPPA